MLKTNLYKITLIIFKSISEVLQTMIYKQPKNSCPMFFLITTPIQEKPHIIMDGIGVQELWPQVSGNQSKWDPTTMYW